MATFDSSLRVRVCREGAVDRSYPLQFQSKLTTNSWVDAGAPIPGTGSRMCVEDALNADPRRFYRFIALP